VVKIIIAGFLPAHTTGVPVIEVSINGRIECTTNKVIREVVSERHSFV